MTLTLIRGENQPPFQLPPGRMRWRAAKNIVVGDLVDIYHQYGYIPTLYSAVQKITHHRHGGMSITVEQAHHWDRRRTRAERTVFVMPRQMIQVWEED